MLGVGIIGTGWVSTAYLAAFAAEPRTTVRGIVARRTGAGTRLLEQAGIRAAVEYPDVDAMLADSAIDIVVSATTPDVRADHVCAAAESGRHVVIEKPVGLNRQDVRRMHDAVRSAGVRSVSSFVLRWHPLFEHIHALVQSNQLGKLVYLEADYRHAVEVSERGGRDWHLGHQFPLSAFLTGGCHAVDTLRFLAGSDIVEVSAIAGPPRRNPDYAYPPNAVATCRFADGAIGKVSALQDGHFPYQFHARLFGTSGSVDDDRWFPADAGLESGFRSLNIAPPGSGDVADHPFRREVSHFVDCIESETESHASIFDAARTMAACFAIDDSIASGGKPVPVEAI